MLLLIAKCFLSEIKMNDAEFCGKIVFYQTDFYCSGYLLLLIIEDLWIILNLNRREGLKIGFRKKISVIDVQL